MSDKMGNDKFQLNAFSFLDEWIQSANDGSILWAGELHRLIHYGLRLEWKDARNLEHEVRCALAEFGDDAGWSGPWHGLQWKKNFPALVYPKYNVPHFKPADDGFTSYEAELMRLPGTRSRRLRDNPLILNI